LDATIINCTSFVPLHKQLATLHKKCINDRRAKRWSHFVRKVKDNALKLTRVKECTLYVIICNAQTVRSFSGITIARDRFTYMYMYSIKFTTGNNEISMWFVNCYNLYLQCRLFKIIWMWIYKDKFKAS
jgi:hypothetical protein